jgi:hypothetical protein
MNQDHDLLNKRNLLLYKSIEENDEYHLDLIEDQPLADLKMTSYAIRVRFTSFLQINKR